MPQQTTTRGDPSRFDHFISIPTGQGAGWEPRAGLEVTLTVDPRRSVTSATELSQTY